MSLLTRERLLYESVWASLDRYGLHAPGEQHAAVFADIVGHATHRTVLDAGCGSGKGALALQALGFEVTLMDLTFDGLVPEARDLEKLSLGPLWAPIWRVFDYVYCCDVLEHLPPELTMLAVARMVEACRGGVFLSIALVPDHFGAWVGEPLHKTVREFVWWCDNLRELGDLVDARDLMTTGLFYLTPR